MPKAVALLSGGLDSTLAIKLILAQGIEVEAVNFLTLFCTCTSRGRSCLASQEAAKNLGIRLKIFEVSREFLDIVRRPRYGYGSNLNPCIDCRIFMLRKAGEYMQAINADFLVTGEVLGERPMSQKRHTMALIEAESGWKDYILRPLSAQLLEPTLPEREGIVDRKRFLSIQGRSRRPQIRLAQELAITDYPCPSGGCLLTDKGFAKRMRDLMQYKIDFDIDDVRFLKIGRHFRIREQLKFIVGRDEKENSQLLDLVQEDDLIFVPERVKGPVGIAKGRITPEDISISASIISRYCDGNKGSRMEVCYKDRLGNLLGRLHSLAMEDSYLEVMRI